MTLFEAAKALIDDLGREGVTNNCTPEVFKNLCVAVLLEFERLQREDRKERGVEVCEVCGLEGLESEGGSHPEEDCWTCGKCISRWLAENTTPGAGKENG